MTEDRDIEKHYPASQFAAKLRRLADCVENGEAFTIQIANERIRVPKRAVFDVEHEREGAEEEIEFQLKWTRDADEDDAEPDADDASDV